jgi:hypothetical protein
VRTDQNLTFSRKEKKKRNEKTSTGFLSTKVWEEGGKRIDQTFFEDTEALLTGLVGRLGEGEESERRIQSN